MHRKKHSKTALPVSKYRPPKVQFGMSPMVVGAVAGMLTGMIVEFIKGPHQVYMQLGGVLGIFFGALIEGIRYWWRKRKQRRPIKP